MKVSVKHFNALRAMAKLNSSDWAYAWQSSIHLRLCEQAEATARTNELLERLLAHAGGVVDDNESGQVA